ncbi:SapC family protein [Lysobacter firmicutimachus]|uniref:SapC family protein n=1 Tax=Lysobacter firmicutimachus TaxID=1792846 RepID=A0AAU8MM21_9GAMM
MLIYDRVVPLNRNTHRRLRISAQSHNARFAATLNSVPLAAIEFLPAASEYAIVFARLDNGDYLPAIMVGLKPQQNLYVDAEARWRRGYVPAFLRQYPFVLAEDRETGNLTVCVDMAYDGLSEEEGEALFEDSGEDTPNLTRALGFLTEFHHELKRTAAFTERLKALDLLEQQVVRFGREGEPPHEINGVYVVSEERLHKLDDATLAELVRSGTMRLIHTHLVSMRNLERLSELAQQRAADEDAPQGAAN